MNAPLRRLTSTELAPYASAGNGFSRIEDARAVARSRPGQEAIAQEGSTYVLYDPGEKVSLSELAAASSSQRIMREFVSFTHQTLNLNNSEGIKGVGEKLTQPPLKNESDRGNAFSRFTHAESVAKDLNQDAAIVYSHGSYQLYALNSDSGTYLLKGQNELLDGRVSAVVHNNKTLYNWGADRVTATAHPGFVSANRSQLMLDGKPYTIQGLNVYDLVDVAKQGDAELRQTLQLIADTGINSVRFLALSQHTPEQIRKVLDTARDMGLAMKFIPVLGNHWQHVEVEHSHFVKDDNWYHQGFEAHYWPHAEATVKALMDRPEILMWELMNEPEGDTETLRGFADEVSTRIRTLYDQRQAETGQPIPRHMISLGTLAVGRWGEERPGMKGHDYKHLYGLPNLDLATVHDYTSDTLEGSIADFMHYASDLNKPFFLGEIGVKVRSGGTETDPKLGLVDRLTGYDPATARQQAIARLQEKVQASTQAHSAGAMLWGPQPRGHAVDGDGYGFSYDRNTPEFKQLKAIWQRTDNN